jgi:hypothetical protein
MPSPADIFSAELTLSSPMASLASPLSGLTRTGVNNITLAWTAFFTQDLNFSVVAESGIVGPFFTVRLQYTILRSDSSWSLQALLPNGFNASISSADDIVARTILVPATAAGTMAILTLFLAAGASVVPTGLFTMIRMATLSWESSFYSFRVLAEDGSSSTGFVTVSFDILPSQDQSWSATISGAGLVPVNLNSASALSITTVRLNYTTSQPIVLADSTLTFWISGTF